jgi:predicted enzyme related to lactoylglutathione lyase
MATKKKKAAPKKKAAKAKPVKRAAAPKKPSGPTVVHWELQSRDPANQQRFFAELFGWKIDNNNPMGYGMVSSGGPKAIDGGIGNTMDAPRVTVYIQVPDINATLNRAQTLGAVAVLPRTDMGMVVMAQFKDLEGNIIGLVEG